MRLVNSRRLYSFLVSILLLCFAHVCSSGSEEADSPKKDNPFSPKACLIRYWSTRIHPNIPKSSFLLSKASPLTAAESGAYAALAAKGNLSSRLLQFCEAGNLFCPLEAEPVLDGRGDTDFSFYSNNNFAKYGIARLGGVDQFKNYSSGANFAIGSFSRYSKESTGRREGFSSYANDGNVAHSNFTSYGSGATGGAGVFSNYMPRVNVPGLRFASYDSSGNDHKRTFSSYSDDANSGNQVFTGYGRNGNAVPEVFTSYGAMSNVIGSTFTGYGEGGNGANDSFKSYTTNSNNPTNTFRNYGAGGNDGNDDFVNYRDSANAGTDSFQSYGKDSNSQKITFANYGKSFSIGFDSFKEYAKDAVEQSVGFKIYGENTTFKDYPEKGVTFDQYTKPGSVHPPKARNGAAVEEGKFFREGMLEEGNIMRMANIKDWMPKRSFLPRAIASKLPFSSKELGEMKRTFGAKDNSTLERILIKALGECERPPSPGETRRCVRSIEDMIDFAVMVLGEKVVARTTDNVAGSGEDILIGKVKVGKTTKSVSCHQSLYPSLLYYCHSVPKVRVYEADIHGIGSKKKINHGVAICHLDTTSWSPNHGAFLALGSVPGVIEVCHWIFENDLTWTVAE